MRTAATTIGARRRRKPGTFELPANAGHERWGTEPLTARDRAAASLGDVLTLAKPRDDDVLAGVVVPVSSGHHPSSSTPSRIDRLHAARVAALPIRNEKGHYEESSPILTSTGELTDFIRDRSAAWEQHLQRQERRRAHRGQHARGHGHSHRRDEV